MRLLLKILLLFDKELQILKHPLSAILEWWKWWFRQCLPAMDDQASPRKSWDNCSVLKIEFNFVCFPLINFRRIPSLSFFWETWNCETWNCVSLNYGSLPSNERTHACAQGSNEPPTRVKLCKNAQTIGSNPLIFSEGQTMLRECRLVVAVGGETDKLENNNLNPPYKGVVPSIK